MNMSDAWTVAIVANLGISGKGRNERWPAVVMKKYLHPDYQRKEQATKAYDSTRKGWYYSVAFGIHQLYRVKREAAGLPQLLLLHTRQSAIFTTITS